MNRALSFASLAIFLLVGCDGKDKCRSFTLVAEATSVKDDSTGVVVNVFPSWEVLFKEDPAAAEKFKKLHPDLILNPEETEKIRTQAVVRLVKVEDMIGSA